MLGGVLSVVGAWFAIAIYLSWEAWEAGPCGANPGPGPHHPCPIMLPFFESPLFWGGLLLLAAGVALGVPALYRIARRPPGG